MIASIWQSDLGLAAGVALGLAATFIAIVRDTAGRVKRSEDARAPGATPLGWPLRRGDSPVPS